MQQRREQWKKLFENKTVDELKAMRPPSELDAASWKVWLADREAALARLSADETEPPADADEERKSDPLIDTAERLARQAERAERHCDALESPKYRNPPDWKSGPVLPKRPLLAIPQGSAAELLERQIATCAALIGDLADYIANPGTSPEMCFPFMDRMSTLLGASASAARVVGQLRGIAAETKQTFVTRKEGKREGGVPES